MHITAVSPEQKIEMTFVLSTNLLFYKLKLVQAWFSCLSGQFYGIKTVLEILMDREITYLNRPIQLNFYFKYTQAASTKQKITESQYELRRTGMFKTTRVGTNINNRRVSVSVSV